MVKTPPSRRNVRGRCGVPPSRVSMRGGRWGVVETPPSRRNARGRCRVGRNAPVSRFDARGALGSGRKGDGDCHQQHCLLLMVTLVLVGLRNFAIMKDRRLDHGYGLFRSLEFPVQIRSRSGPVSVFLQFQDWTYKHYTILLNNFKNLSCMSDSEHYMR